MRLLVFNLFRKPLRTFLTIFGVAVALFLFCFLETVLAAFSAGVAMADASRLVVQHKESLAFSLPVSYKAPIMQIEGVREASGAIWFGGLSQEPQPNGEKREEFFAQFGLELESYLSIYPEVQIPENQLRDLMQDQAGCVLGDKIAERLNKKVGDRIRIKSTIWSKPEGPMWDFTVRAIYTSDSTTFDRTMMLFHLKYLDEGRVIAKGTVGIFFVSMSDPNRYSEIIQAVDRRFENSPYETRTITERAFAMQFVTMMGNLQLLLRSIGSAVVLTMLLVSANTMMMSGRERTREMGILKAIGFTDLHVFMLLIGEAMLIVMAGAVLGAGGGYVSVNLMGFNPKPDFFPVFVLPLPSLGAAFLIAAVTGLLSGIVPAIVGMRLKATEALRSI